MVVSSPPLGLLFSDEADALTLIFELDAEVLPAVVLVVPGGRWRSVGEHHFGVSFGFPTFVFGPGVAMPPAGRASSPPGHRADVEEPGLNRS